jgi:enoyl-CoA hydratase
MLRREIGIVQLFRYFDAGETIDALEGIHMSDGLNGGPRPPDGDWLGTPFLHFQREGAFAICTLDRPKARNAMTPAMYFGIRYAISRVNADPDLAGLLITGTGDVFAPGGDLGQAAEDNWMDFASTMGMDVTPFDVLRQSPKPVVSAVNGLCQGGGLQIAMCSDLAVVSERATFRVPELFRGIADTYYSQVLARLIGPVRTKDLMFTGRTLSAQEALDWGMVARVVPHDDLLDVAKELLGQCCRTAPAARGVVKASLDNYLGLFDRIGMQTSMFGPEAREGFRAFKEKNSPTWVHPELQLDGRL